MTKIQLDTLVRDLTQVAPRSKSEVRRKILELLATERKGWAEHILNAAEMVEGDAARTAMVVIADEIRKGETL